MISREGALELLKKQNMEDNLLRHSLQSEAVLSSLAKKLGQDNTLWSITGLLHDVDFPYTASTPEKHGIMAMEIINNSLPEEGLYAIRAHNSEHTGCEPKSTLDYALRAGETVTGIINTAALVRPNGFDGMEAKSIKKKMKDKAFAASVNRETIRECEKLGLDLDTFLTLSISAIASIS